MLPRSSSFPVALLGVVLLGIQLAAAQAVNAQDVTVFRDVAVIPMQSAAETVLQGQTVVVRGERIETVGPSADVTVPPGARVIEGAGRYLLPGLTEMHAHVPGDGDRRYLEEVLFLYVAKGVTTARGMLGQPSHLALREQLARHEVLGPRLYTSGPSLSGQNATDPEATARLVREQAAAGYDFVKVHPGPTRAAYDAAAQAAADSGTALAGHVPADVGLLRALEAGQVTVDHLDGYVEALVPEAQRANAGFFGFNLAEAADRDRLPALIAATVEAGAWNVPTQTLIEHWPAPTPTLDELLARPEMAYVSPQTRTQWANSKRQMVEAPGYSAERGSALVTLRQEILKALHDAGAGLLLGSDAPQVFNVPGFSLHHEIASMVAAGLTPYEVLRTGTANPAIFFDAADEFGTIREGLAADLILVDGNPLENLDALAWPDGVMVRGVWLDRADIDARLAEIAARYR
jgi:imidazolonepropionase-like amidohydrolase